MSPIIRTCARPRCGAFIQDTERYCSRHKRLERRKELIRTDNRQIAEPWRAVYREMRWQRCKRAVRSRDDFLCRNCGQQGDPAKAGYGLQVHHCVPLRTLWHRAQEDWLVFLPMATNADICVTLCPSCHKEADLAQQKDDEQRAYQENARNQWAKERRRNHRR